ncbi:MAG TPA: glycoside hydrolase family 76 protein [Solirubrobacteraceae bacterium]|nr:glycoside hydrolase family 76 protein [Solirubrobacteraceae bacterium]
MPRSKIIRSGGLPTVLLALLVCFLWFAGWPGRAGSARADNASGPEQRSLARQSSFALALRMRRGGAALASRSQTYLQVAEAGVKLAKRFWWNPRLGWYDSRLDDGERYPLATIWDSTPLFEALDAIDIAAPSASHRAAVEAFAKGAERYWDATLKPYPGFAPYPGDRGDTLTWFDDNGWWGLAFLDAYRATGVSRYLREAQRAFAFIARAGWNSKGGGLWWNTAHPYIAGEPLAAGALLGARLLKLTGKQYYRTEVLKFLDWAESDFLTERRLYKRTESDSTPTPYIEGTLVEAHQVLCEIGISDTCERAAQLADASAERFSDRLNMGPQFDTIYLHWMLVYGSQVGETRWQGLAEEMARDAQQQARNAQGLYLRAWDGTPITEHQALPNMLQTDASTLELFAWLGVAESLRLGA